MSAAFTPKFTAIYRNGGTDNFSWHRVMNPTSYRIAAADVAILRRGGRAAYVLAADDHDAFARQQRSYAPIAFGLVTPDVDCSKLGTVVLFQPITEQAREWFNAMEPRSSNLTTICVDQAMATDLYDALTEQGYRVSGDWR